MTEQAEQAPYDYPMVPRDQGDPGGHVYGDAPSAGQSASAPPDAPTEAEADPTQDPASSTDPSTDSGSPVTDAGSGSSEADPTSAGDASPSQPASPTSDAPSGDAAPEDPTTAEPPEPEASPTSGEPATDAPSGTAEPSPDPSVPVTMAEATMGDNPDAPVSSVAVHPSVMVRLADVYAHIENWAAHHPELERFLAAELKSSIGTAERLNDQGGAA